MTDIKTKEERSRNMAAIKGKDTKPEMIVRKYLFSRGLRFRVQVRKLPGNPDIVLPKYKTVIFVNGCFWHGHEGCRYFRLPKSNIEFWEEKIERNVARDVRNEAELKALGWRVVRVWECEIKTVAQREEYLKHLYDRIVNPVQSYLIETDIDKPSIAAEPESAQIYGNNNHS
ncbi:very short patch repair endonuclease [Bacteroides acidifaciens]|uniref:very short patch repair endonuclease n=1 Tax=Bacteroides acidifaciens TaxID=85831 RepID=UPI002557E080|nr:very short patch repair endonuclease [Bacteroides acidifaciens]